MPTQTLVCRSYVIVWYCTKPLVKEISLYPHVSRSNRHKSKHENSDITVFKSTYWIPKIILLSGDFPTGLTFDFTSNKRISSLALVKQYRTKLTWSIDNESLVHDLHPFWLYTTPDTEISRMIFKSLIIHLERKNKRQDSWQYFFAWV